MSVALALRAVTRSLRARRVLSGLDLVVHRGECHALAGLNGAGKTTALRIALGMLRPDSGTVEVLGRKTPSASHDIWRSVGHLVETPFSYPELTARQNIIASAILHGHDPAALASGIAELAGRLGLTDWLDVPARRLSLGTRQKVGLVAAMAHRPRLLILDEPTNALDPLAIAGLRGLITDLTHDGTAVLVTSHHFDELARIAHRVDVLHAGHVVDSLRPDGPDLEARFFETVLAAEKQTR
jgi:ABC transporter related protein